MRHAPISLRISGDLVERVDRLVEAIRSELPTGAALSRNSYLTAVIEMAVQAEEKRRGLAKEG